MVADIYNSASYIPLLFRRILGEKALESTFLPVHKSLLARNQIRLAEAYSLRVFRIFTRITLGVVLVCLVLSPWLPYLISANIMLKRDLFLPGFGQPVGRMMLWMVVLFIPYILLVNWFSFSGAKLLSLERFTPYSIAPAMATLISIPAMLLLFPLMGVYALPLSLLLAGLAQVIYSFWSSRQPHPGPLSVEEEVMVREKVRKTGTMSGPIFLDTVLERMGMIVDTQMASFIGEGAVSALKYGKLMVLMPFGVLSLSINRAIMTRMTQNFATGRIQDFRADILRGYRLTLLTQIPASLGMILLAHPIIQVCFQRGEFSRHSTDLTSLALWCFAIGLTGMGLTGFLSRSFYARHDTKTPVKVSALCLGLNVLFNFCLWKTPLAHGGLALATSLAFTINAIVLFYILHRGLAAQGQGLTAREIAGPLFRVLLCGGAMAAVLFLLRSRVPIFTREDSLLWLKLGLEIVLGMAVYGVACLLLPLPEVTAWIKILGKKPKDTGSA
jgi:putative peptidoglycan lipid II flippase